MCSEHTESVDCLTNWHQWYSKPHQTRCVEELFWGGFVMYEFNGEVGVHRGVCSRLGAYQWLNGEPVECIDGRMIVDGVTIVDKKDNESEQ